MGAVAWLFGDPRRLRLAQRLSRAGRLLARVQGHTHRISWLPGPGRAWTRCRDLPAPPAASFRDWWEPVSGPVNAREEVLARLRAGAADGAAPTEIPPRGYRRADGRPAGDPGLLDLLVDRLEDYSAVVHRGPADGLAATVARGPRRPRHRPPRRPRRAADRAGPRAVAAGVELRRDDPPLTVAELDGADSVLTGCAVAVADTGTIVLDAVPTRAVGRSPSSPTTTSASCAPTRSSASSPRPSPASTPPARSRG